MPESCSILIVDDEPAILAALRLAFEETGWRIETAPSGERALARLREEKFDVYIVDKNLSGMTGIELVRRLRELGDQGVVLVMTGYASAASAGEALNLGVDAYLEKPFDDIFDLTRRVRQAIEARRRARRSSRPPPPLAPGTPAPAQGRPERPRLKILVASPIARMREQLSRLLPDDNVATAGPVGQVLEAVASTAPDLVILEGGYGAEIAGLVEGLRASAVRPAVAVVAERLGLPQIRRLIELEVRSFLDGSLEGATYRARFADMVNRYRDRKLLRSFFAPPAGKTS